MKRDFSAVISDLDGVAVRQGLTVQALSSAMDKVWPDLSPDQRAKLTKAIDDAAGAQLTLGKACVIALMSPYRDEENLPGDERLARMELARKVNKGGVVDITPADRDRLNPLLRKAFAGPLVSVVASELLEAEVPSDAPAKV